MSSNAPLVELRGIGKQFPGVLALDEVDLELRAGEVHALVGENGAGKSTLIKILTGALRPDRGEIRIEGRAQRFVDPRAAGRAGIAAIHQELTRIPGLSVAENLLLGREPRRGPFLDRATMRARARAALARVELELDVDRRLGSFSYGVQQMVAIARALDQEARVLVLDEPTAALDRREAQALIERLRELARRGLAIVLIGHRLGEILSVAARVTVLRNGRLVGVFLREQVDELSLVEHMLGRERARPDGRERAQATRIERGAETSPSVLEARALTGPGLAAPIDVALRRGEVLGVAGLLGSGRSELVALLFGAARRTSGTVELAGTLLAPGDVRAAVDAGLGSIPEERQSDALLPELSVRENLLLVVARGFARRSPREEERLARDLVSRLGIACASLDVPVRELSGGNQQKVVLARWLAARPRALLLDEPTRGVDVGARGEIEALVRRLAVEGLAVLLVSSDLDELLALSDRVRALHAGRDAGSFGPGEREVLEESALLRAMAGPGAGSDVAP